MCMIKSRNRAEPGVMMPGTGEQGERSRRSTSSVPAWATQRAAVVQESRE